MQHYVCFYVLFCIHITTVCITFTLSQKNKNFHLKKKKITNKRNKKARIKQVDYNNNKKLN